MIAAAMRPPNRPMPERTRAVVRARYLRRSRRGSILMATDRLPVFAIGELIAQLVERRVAAGLSTEDIEQRAGLADNHLAKVEAGERFPSLDLFLLLVETLGGEVTVTWTRKPR